MIEQTVRAGEWNEAVCFTDMNYPRIEIAAQKSKDSWNIFYITPYRVVTLRSFSGSWDSVKSVAVYIAGHLANRILTTSNPTKYMYKHYYRE